MSQLLWRAVFAAVIMSVCSGLSFLPVKANDQKIPASNYWRGGYFGPSLSLTKLQKSYDPSKAPDFRKLKANGKVVGAVAGYNFLDDKLMYGIEGDISTGAIFNSNLSLVSTARARIGKPMNYTLPYVTAGLVVAKAKNSISGKTQFGLVAGAGVEQVLAQAVSGRLEYTYGQFLKSSSGNAHIKNFHLLRASIVLHLSN